MLEANIGKWWERIIHKANANEFLLSENPIFVWINKEKCMCGNFPTYRIARGGQDYLKFCMGCLRNPTDCRCAIQESVELFESVSSESASSFSFGARKCMLVRDFVHTKAGKQMSDMFRTSPPPAPRAEPVAEIVPRFRLKERKGVEMWQ